LAGGAWARGPAARASEGGDGMRLSPRWGVVVIVVVISVGALAGPAIANPVVPSAPAMLALWIAPWLGAAVIIALEVGIALAEAAAYTSILAHDWSRMARVSLIGNAASFGAGVLLLCVAPVLMGLAYWARFLCGLVTICATEVPLVVALIRREGEGRPRVPHLVLGVNALTCVVASVAPGVLALCARG